jgi:putative addiction module component (TIGR02574 family)
MVIQATALPPLDRLELVDRILESLDIPDKKIEKLWADETQNRWNAYKSGEIRSVSAAEVFEKYKP